MTDHSGDAANTETGTEVDSTNTSDESTNTNASVQSSAGQQNWNVPKASDTDQESNAVIETKLASMTLEEKVAQMFVVTPEALTGAEQVTSAGTATLQAIDKTPVGGIIYMGNNIQTADQVRTMVTNSRQYSKDRIGLDLFTCVDEEGGLVRRISGHIDGIETIPPMADIGATNDNNKAYEIGLTMGTYLSDLGFNVDFAPEADVLTNPNNTVISTRAFSSDAQVVAEMAPALASGLEQQGVLATYKHFPGHGNTDADSHEGYAYSDKTLDELRDCELIPFQAAINFGAKFIMVGHISLPNGTEEDVPASMSEELITNLLREEMGYDGIVITDAMNMGAIANQYSSAESAVKAVSAGVDMILMPTSFSSAYQAVIAAVNDGTLSEERIDESVRRILKVKNEISPIA